MGPTVADVIEEWRNSGMFCSPVHVRLCTILQAVGQVQHAFVTYKTPGYRSYGADNLFVPFALGVGRVTPETTCPHARDVPVPAMYLPLDLGER